MCVRCNTSRAGQGCVQCFWLTHSPRGQAKKYPICLSKCPVTCPFLRIEGKAAFRRVRSDAWTSGRFWWYQNHLGPSKTPISSDPSFGGASWVDSDVISRSLDHSKAPHSLGRARAGIVGDPPSQRLISIRYNCYTFIQYGDRGRV